MIKGRMAGAAALVLSLVLAACSSGDGGSSTTAGSKDLKPEDMKIVTVVKLLGVGWFDRMETGIDEFGQEEGTQSSMTGADDASPEKQVKIIQDLIAQKPTAITVVPNAPEALEGVLKQARNAGIFVVTHEASNQKNTDVDIEAFDNDAYGAHIMDNLSECMGGEGKYVAFVGHLTAKSHMEWVEGAFNQAESKYADIERIGDPIEGLEDANVAYQKTKELLAKYPDIKGFEGSAATDVAGIGRAIQEAGLQDKTCVMGTSIPSIAGKFLDDGSIDKIFFWDPALAGKAQQKLAVMLAQGEKIKEGLDLELTGYEDLKRIKGTPAAYAGNAWIDVDKSNAKDYPF
ncbi:MAG: autoinducer 2 ABC transporter substrate-binding protein [Sporichthyaceae bacterium]|nr:autoinducer 2 ABC transporter substrate-binding protein [Sporichthyaceae bacterium]